jgi:hypothetical protein
MTISTMIVYTPSYFHRIYLVRMTLFLSIMHKLSETSPYFSEMYHTTGRVGLTTLQKCTVALHQLAYGMTANTIDEYLKIGKSTVQECLKYYCLDIVECFRVEFLCRPTVTDTQRLLTKIEDSRFFGILGSIYCMHWQ